MAADREPQKEPPRAIVVTWTEKDWDERWPHRLEEMLVDSPVKKAPFITALLKEAVLRYEKTGKIFEKPPGYQAKRKP